MTFYSEMASTASELLAEFGGAVTLNHAGGVPDPVTGLGGTTGGSTATTGLVKPFPDSWIDGTRIQAGDRQLVLTSAVAPSPDDTVTIGGENWTIVRIETVKPASEVVVYFVQVRK